MTTRPWTLHPVRAASAWWLWLWGAVMAALVVAAFLVPFFVPFVWWAAAVLVAFGSMEAVGVAIGDPEHPPLTDVVRAFVPLWVSLPAMWALLAAAVGRWFGLGPLRSLEVAVAAGLAGWLICHFDDAYR